MSPSRSDEIKRLKEAVRLVEKSGQKDTVFHRQLAELEKPAEPEKPPKGHAPRKDDKPAAENSGEE